MNEELVIRNYEAGREIDKKEPGAGPGGIRR